MKHETTGRLIFLSGPSCMGKGSLLKVVKKFNRDTHDKLRRVVMYNSRAPRPGETDGNEFHFRPRAYIEKLAAEKDLLALEVRGDLHALNLKKLHKVVRKHDALLIDTPFMVKALCEHPEMPQVPIISIMMVPISREEILLFRGRHDRVFSLSDFITDLMRRKLLRRTRRQKNNLSMKDLEDTEVRAANAYGELKEAHHFDYVLVNHEGGDNEYWSSFYYPVGDPLRVMNDFVALVEGKPPIHAEKWEEGLLP